MSFTEQGSSTLEPSKHISYKSVRKLKHNSVLPNVVDHEDEKPTNTVPNHLFSSQKSKAKKSYLIDVTPKRRIHVRHYAQHEVDLHPVDNFTVDDHFNVVLFFIHGVGGSSQMWHPQIQYFLYKGYEIISLDLLGHGLSSKPNDANAYLFSELANDVIIIFDKFSKKKNVVIGHSYGSSFCTLLAKQRSQCIAKMVLISGGGPTTLTPEQCSAFCLPYPMFYLISPGVVKVFRNMAFHDKTNNQIKKKIMTFTISPFTLKAIMQGQYWSDSNEEFHSNLVVPVLLIHGKGDQFVSLDEEIWMNETIYGSHLEVIDNAGHMVTIEAPEAVNRAIGDFLNRDASTSLCGVECPHTPEHAVKNKQSTSVKCQQTITHNTSRASVRSGRRKTLY